MKTNFKFFFLIFSILVSGCVASEDYLPDNAEAFWKPDVPVIEINTTRDVGNILETETQIDGSVITRANDPFTQTREVESFESIVLPELQPHIWIGNILTKSSIVDCIYKPLIYPRKPITVSTTLPGTNPKEIDNPTFSKYLSYVQEQTSKGTYKQNGEFNFTMEQFTSYHELKAVFGSNVNTTGLFKKSSSSVETEDHQIQMATGMYVKFYQTSFKVVMDYPHEKIAEIPANMIDSAVYINSITYGRLGILTVETNESATRAEEKLTQVFNKIFKKGGASLSTVEKNFLKGCDFRIYLIGGNGSTSVETFKGVDAFKKHIVNGTFSVDEPGAPLFCTFNHVKDNSPAYVKFKFSIKKQPLYVELFHQPTATNKDGEGILSLKFYRNQSKIPTIADPKIKFTLITRRQQQEHGPASKDGKFDLLPRSETYQNAGYQTSIELGNITTYYSKPDIRHYYPRDGWETDWGWSIWSEYYLVPGEDFVIVGKNPINHDNTFN